MRLNMILRDGCTVLGAICSCTLLTTRITHAQTAEAPAPPVTAGPSKALAAGTAQAESGLTEIVVTGTLLRGTTPAGTNVIEVSRDEITATGAVTTQELLATVPQITNQFNQTPTAGIGSLGLTVIRPNIRNLAANGGNTTLVLLDGHNMVGAGVLQTTPDIGVIPPGALERLEVVPDGGSSIYGSDAIGGIVNLITRKDLQGVEVVAHGGYADQFWMGDVNISAGRSWGSGSILLSYDYRDNTDLLGRDRSYHRQNLKPFGGTDFRTNACQPGNVTANGVNYALPGFTRGVTNLCDQGLYSDIYPEEHQHSLFGRISQSLGDHAEFDVSGYFARRVTNTAAAQDSTSSAIVTAFNPYFHSVAGEFFQQVALSYAGVLGPSLNNTTALTDYGVTPQVTFKLSHGWEVTALANVGESINESWSPSINAAAQSAALAGITTAQALNPYNIGATNPAVLAAITNYGENVRTVEKLAEARVVANGDLFHLPGGDMRLAVGSQFHYESFDGNFTESTKGDLSPAGNILNAQGNRRSEAVFGEFLVPLVGTDNAVPLIHTLNVDVSARYDHYSDFGGTTNPKIGITYKPVQDLTIRGNFGTSFNAPSLADETGGTTIQVIGVSPYQKSFSPTDLFRPTWVLAGVAQNVQPQTAHTYSVGADFQPSLLKGLTLSMTYWNVSLKNIIEVIPFYQPAIFTNPGLAQYYILNPTLAQATTFINSFVPPALLIGGQKSIAANYGLGAPYAIFDAQRVNLGTLNTNGLDFNGIYSVATVAGTVSASLGGTLTLKRTSTSGGGAPFDELAGNSVSPLQLAATLGDRYQNFTARAMLLYSAGYPVVSAQNQSRVAAFHPVNLYFAYDLQGRYLDNATLSLNIDNVGDESPPFENLSGGNGTANGQTYGRYFNVGVRKKF
jgi:iron complex outermembrane receptor protein